MFSAGEKGASLHPMYVVSIFMQDGNENRA